MKKINIYWVIAGLLIIIQVFRIDKTHPPFLPEQDFITISNPPDNFYSMLKNSCYDCHSYETEYPWYSNVAPVSWFLKMHVNEGRSHLNFSDWGNFDTEKSNIQFKKCIKVIEDGEMPLISYTLLHLKARLNENKRLRLASWIKSQQKM
ncbi:MAG: heme-binding domain-containing protein [Bacteroidales bacterium]|nr:heme-binding domain-containing protein [Bacteroidales bacterium]